MAASSEKTETASFFSRSLALFDFFPRASHHAQSKGTTQYLRMTENLRISLVQRRKTDTFECAFFFPVSSPRFDSLTFSSTSSSLFYLSLPPPKQAASRSRPSWPTAPRPSPRRPSPSWSQCTSPTFTSPWGPPWPSSTSSPPPPARSTCSRTRSWAGRPTAPAGGSAAGCPTLCRAVSSTARSSRRCSRPPRRCSVARRPGTLRRGRRPPAAPSRGSPSPTPPSTWPTPGATSRTRPWGRNSPTTMTRGAGCFSS